MKLLNVIFILSICILLAIGILYFLASRSKLPFAQQFFQNRAIQVYPVQQDPNYWGTVLHTILPNCRMTPVAETVDLPNAFQYFSKLFDKLGGVTANASDFSFDTTDHTHFEEVHQYGAGGNLLLNEQVPSCWIAWTGDQQGDGAIAYEDTTGVIQTHAVKAYPLTLITTITPMP